MTAPGPEDLPARMTRLASAGVGLHTAALLREGARRIEQLERETADLLDQLDQKGRLP